MLKYSYLIKKFILFKYFNFIWEVCIYIKYNELCIIIFFSAKYYFKKIKWIPKVLISFLYFQCNFITIIEYLSCKMFESRVLSFCC